MTKYETFSDFILDAMKRAGEDSIPLDKLLERTAQILAQSDGESVYTVAIREVAETWKNSSEIDWTEAETLVHC